MKIILHYPEMLPLADQVIINWINELIADKGCNNITPWRYVDRVEVEGRNKEYPDAQRP